MNNKVITDTENVSSSPSKGYEDIDWRFLTDVKIKSEDGDD